MSKRNVSLIIFSSVALGFTFATSICVFDCIDFKDKFNNLTSTLFSGFLTISAFVFAFETFIVFKMREDVYDSEYYKETFAKELSNKERYIPLKNFSDLLMESTAISFFTAIMFVVYIFWKNDITFVVTITLSLTTIAYLSISWFLLKKNLSYYFSFLGKQH